MRLLRVIFIFFIFPHLTYALVSVSAFIDRNQVELGEFIELTVKISLSQDSEIVEPRLPALSGFNLIQSSSDTQTQTSVVNGKVQALKNYLFYYHLQVIQNGLLNIQPIEVVIGNKKYKTEPLVIRVGVETNEQGTPNFLFLNEEDDPFADLLKQRNALKQGVEVEAPFFIELELSQGKAYVGEMIVSTWYLYTRGQLHEFDALKYPALKGFWKEDIEMPTRFQFEQSLVNGIMYQRALIAQFALFPIQPGESTIDSFQVKCRIAFGNFGFLGSAEYYTRQSKEFKMKILPLPTENQPEFFTGGVGDHDLTLELEKDQVIGGEPFLIKLKIFGKGNAKWIELPKINWPENIKIYDVKKKTGFNKNMTSYHEYHIFVIPKQPGTLKLPEIKFAFFIPETNKYIIKSVEPIDLIVLPGKVKEASEKPHLEVKKTEDLFPGIIQYEKQPQHLSNRTKFIFWILMHVAILCLFLIRVYFLIFKKKRVDLVKEIKKRIKYVEKMNSKKDWRALGSEAIKLIYFVVGEVSGQGGASTELKSFFLHTSPSFRHHMAEPIQKYVEYFQEVGFSSPEVAQQLIIKSEPKKMLNELEQLLLKAASFKSGVQE